jgi:asparagine synthase (glutamine-hydrolysing)
MEGSPDLYYARLVSAFIGSTHHEVIISAEDMLKAIPKTIEVIESFDTTSVRASVGNYLISKYISEHFDFKVVYNGDGSDEFGSYMYFGNAPTECDFHLEANRLLNEISYFDVLRSDRSISSNGLEGRVPFLDKAFARYYASIPAKFKMHTYGGIEKYILRKAFENEDLLPREVLWRSKMAFSDGVSQKSKSWHKIISDYVDSNITDQEFETNKKIIKHCAPELKESYLYRILFDTYFGSHNAIVIPHFWLPKWCGDIIDPSARQLSFVND